ncbi:MAG: insulinase family protein [Pyrinomonadaceae bacterium]
MKRTQIFKAAGRYRHFLVGVLTVSLAYGLILILRKFIPEREPGLPPVREIGFERFVLPNGLEVIVHRDASAPTASVNLSYRVGSRDEPRGKTGLAHLTEHLMLEAAARKDSGSDSVTEQLGAWDYNGSTDCDRTRLYMTVPKPALFATWISRPESPGPYVAASMPSRTLALVWPLPGDGSPDLDYLDLARHILEARLNQRLTFKAATLMTPGPQAAGETAPALGRPRVMLPVGGGDAPAGVAPEQKRLPNGLTVFVAKRPGPVGAVKLVWRKSPSLTVRREVLTKAALSLLSDGGASLRASELRRDLAHLSSQLVIDDATDYYAIGLELPVTNLVQGLEALSGLAVGARFEESQAAEVRRRWQKRLKRAEPSSWNVYLTALLRLAGAGKLDEARSLMGLLTSSAVGAESQPTPLSCEEVLSVSRRLPGQAGFVRLVLGDGERLAEQARRLGYKAEVVRTPCWSSLY